MELTRASSAVLRRIYLLVFGAVLVSAAAYVWSARQHPTYRATAQVVVTLHIGSTVSSEHLGLTETLAQKYATLTLPEAVVDAMYLAVPARTPANIRRELTMSAVAGQPLITITTQDTSPSVARDLANSAAIAFVNYYSQQSFAAESALAQQETALQTQLQQLNGKISQTQTALAAAQKQGSDTSALSQQLTALQAQQSQISDQLATVTKQRGAPLADFWVASQATTSQQVGASPQANAAYGAAAGLFAGLCAALLLDLLDGTVRKSDDTMRFAGLSTLGAVRALSDEEDEPSLIRQEGYTAIAGSYNELMRNLVFLGATRSLQTLLVAPTDAVSGMDQVGINLAITYALAGVRTLVVDANWQRPTLETRIGLSPASQGIFTSLVAATKNSDAALDAIVPTPVDNLFALPVGPLPPNLEELVQSSLLDRLNSTLMVEFEQIVVLAPAQLRDTTARHLAERMDGALIVARAGATTGRELADASQALRRANSYLAGAVLMTQSHVRVPDASAPPPGASRPAAPIRAQPVSVPGSLPLDAGT
jgi:capsular polysaccharide biosynthesis protein